MSADRIYAAGSLSVSAALGKNTHYGFCKSFLYASQGQRSKMMGKPFNHVSSTTF